MKLAQERRDAQRLAHLDLAESVFKVVLQKSSPAQIWQLILEISIDGG